MTVQPGINYLTAFNHWLDVQNGWDRRGQDAIDTSQRRFVRNLRDLGERVHIDNVGDFFFNTCLILLHEVPGNQLTGSGVITRDMEFPFELAPTSRSRSVMYSLARYYPWEWDGYSMGRGDYIASRDNEARWYQAEIEVRCTAMDLYLFGRIVMTLDRYMAVANFGTVEECSSGPHTGYLDETAYDPYDSGWGGEGDSCATHTGSGSGGGGGSGTQFEPGQHTGGETVDWATGIGNGGTSVCGDAAVVEYVCIEIWNDVGQKWDYYACGYATTC